MAGITSKGMYGLAAMYQLMCSDKNQPMQIKQIAKKANIPHNYLDQILIQLKKNGLIKSVRGASGGYMMLKEPQDITIYEIIEILEDGLCNATTDTDNEVLNLFWKEKQKKVREIFKVPLTELKKFEELNTQMMYTI